MTETLKNKLKAALTKRNFKFFKKTLEEAIKENFDFKAKYNYNQLFEESFHTYFFKNCYDKKMIALYIDSVDIDVNVLDFMDRTIAESCALHSNYEALNILLEKYPQAEIKSKIILEALIKIIWRHLTNKKLSNSVSIKLIDKVKNKKDLNKVVLETTLLNCAISNNHQAIFKKLLSVPEVDLNKKDPDGETPLMYSVHNLSFCKALIKKGVKLNLRHSIHGTAAHRAADCLEFESLKVLIKAGANINLKNSLGENPLVSCIICEPPIEIIKLLLKTLDINSVDNKGCSILHTMVYFKADTNENYIQQVVDLEGLNLDIQDYLGRTALHLAVIKKNFFLANYLLEKGADRKIKDLVGWTPLMYAINNNYLKDVKKLVEVEDKETLNNLFDYFSKKQEVEFSTLQILTEYLV